ncbi:MAG: anti-sigma factor [Bacteroidetes bacterium]|nr:anti-sigma factor [Bacteroidota bacterium]
MFNRFLAAAVLIAMLYLPGCSEDASNNPAVQNGNLNLIVNGLEDLGSTAVYEGWIIVSGSPKSTGTFTVNSSGQLSKSSFEVNLSDLNNATAFVISIEPVPDPSPDPSSNKILAGDFSGNTANILISHPAALGTDFSSASGSYIIGTPTDGEMNNELSGIWFLKLPPPPQQGLQLPVLPSGWKYEGWVVVPGSSSPLSTGKFTSASGSDEASPYSGSMPGPPFPGEDLLQNAPSGYTFPVNLQNGVAVISIEPDPDNSAAPFALKPLVGNIPADAADHVTYNMANQSSANNPSGTVTR